jgi:phytoene/squalene synthetase
MVSELQQFDSERYISYKVFLPKNKFLEIESLLLLNLEIARIKNKVTEPMIGLIRLAWWKEAIAEIFNNSLPPKDHKIIQDIKTLNLKKKLSQEDIISMISAREMDMEDFPFLDENALKEYLFSTSYLLNKICFEYLFEPDEAINEIIKSISLAWGYVSILKASSKNFSRGRSVIPKTLLSKYDINISEYGLKIFLDKFKKPCEEIIFEAKKLLENASQDLKKLNKKELNKLKPYICLLNITKANVRQIELNEYDVLTKPLKSFVSPAVLIKTSLSIV